MNFLPKPRLLKSNLWLRRKMVSTIELSYFYLYLPKYLESWGFDLSSKNAGFSCTVFCNVKSIQQKCWTNKIRRCWVNNCIWLLSRWVWSVRSLWECSVSRIIYASIRKKLPFQSTATDVIFTIETLIGKTYQKIRLKKEKKNYINRFFRNFC